MEIYICDEMRNTANIENKLTELKGLIKMMNSSTVDLINLSAAVEINLRNGNESETETKELEQQLDKFLNQYKSEQIAKEN